ncbi:MAG: hypothetical protein U0804_28425 [Gemmataceae bacterium]
MAHRGRRGADERLAALLAAGRTVREAADEAEVSERTAHRRQADPAFAARVAELRGQMVAAATGRLADGLGEAVGVLRALLAHDNPAVRLRAAAKLVELGVKLVVAADEARRLAVLEEQMDRLDADAAGPGQH